MPLRKSQAERTWTCTWTAIGLETQQRAGARLECLCGEDYICSDICSTVQNVIGLSTAESEYYALTTGGCSGLGLQSFLADSLHTDTSSAKAVASRRGVGKSIRHVQTRMLWRQERVAAKHLRVVKVANESNPADAKTVDKKPTEFKKLKKIKFAVERMETSDARIKNEPNDEVAEIKNESKDAKLRWMHTMD